MKADIYFQQNAHKAGECMHTPLVEAYKVKAGDTVIVDTDLGIPMQARNSENGWQLNGADLHAFMTDDEFTKHFKPAMITATRELPEGADVTSVKKGEKIFTQPWSDTILGVFSKASTDGFLVSLPENDNKPRFMSDSDFRATFKTNAAPLKNADNQGMFQYIVQPEDKPRRYLILENDVAFDFISGPYTAKAGSVLFENENDEDGYSVTSNADSFFKNHKITRPASGPSQAPGMSPT